MSQLEDFFTANALYFWCALAAVVVLARSLGPCRSAPPESGGLQSQPARRGRRRGEPRGRSRATDSVHPRDEERSVETLQGDLGRMSESLQFAVQRVGLVRFNPFDDTGGDQSFAVALLDARGDGVVLSSLFASTGDAHLRQADPGRQVDAPALPPRSRRRSSSANARAASASPPKGRARRRAVDIAAESGSEPTIPRSAARLARLPASPPRSRASRCSSAPGPAGTPGTCSPGRDPGSASRAAGCARGSRPSRSAARTAT